MRNYRQNQFIRLLFIFETNGEIHYNVLDIDVSPELCTRIVETMCLDYPTMTSNGVQPIWKESCSHGALQLAPANLESN